VSEYWPSDDFADAVERERAEREAIQLPLLDPRGVTSQKPFEQIARERWDSGMELAGKLRAGGLDALAERFEGCHSQRTIIQCSGCAKISEFWNRCDTFYCPQCSPALSKKRLDGLMFFVDAMERTKHIVLTFKNVTRLTADYLSECKAKLGRFRRRKIFAGAKSGMWAMEVTNNGNGWHVHFHLVVDCAWIPVRELSAQWEKVCGDGSKVVWIEDATRGGLKANLPRYVCKYASKGFRPQDWSGEQFCEFVTAVADGRTFGVFGSLLGKRKEWREWLREHVASKKKCSCGCSLKKYFSPLEWDWHCLQREARVQRAGNAPNTPTQQVPFCFGV
jgi:hypothetical protein